MSALAIARRTCDVELRLPKPPFDRVRSRATRLLPKLHGNVRFQDDWSGARVVDCGRFPTVMAGAEKRLVRHS